MSPLHWQETSQSSSTPVSSTGIIGSIVGLMSSAAFSLLLMGLIAGFGVGKWRTGTSPAVAYAPPAQVIQAPLPQALPPRGGGGCGL